MDENELLLLSSFGPSSPSSSILTMAETNPSPAPASCIEAESSREDVGYADIVKEGEDTRISSHSTLEDVS